MSRVVAAELLSLKGSLLVATLLVILNGGGRKPLGSKGFKSSIVAFYFIPF